MIAKKNTYPNVHTHIFSLEVKMVEILTDLNWKWRGKTSGHYKKSEMRALPPPWGSRGRGGGRWGKWCSFLSNIEFAMKYLYQFGCCLENIISLKTLFCCLWVLYWETMTGFVLGGGSWGRVGSEKGWCSNLHSIQFIEIINKENIAETSFVQKSRKLSD